MILIITGHPRSGTTMLRSFCNRHPDMAVTHEFGNFLYLQRPYGEHAKMLWARWRTVRSRWGYTRSFKPPLTSLNNLGFTLRYLWALRRVSGGAAGIDADLAGRAMGRVFHSSAIVGDKLPQYRTRLDEFASDNNIRCLLIYRDCRDVTSSFLKKKRTDWKGSQWVEKFDSAAKIAQRWADDMAKMKAYNGRAFVIRYEDLVQKPETVVPALSQWLGVPAAGFNLKMLSADSIGKYKNGLSAAEVAEVMETAGETMAEFGYI